MSVGVVPVALVTGFGLGFLVAAEVGPVCLLAIRTVIRGQLSSGIALGLGAATIDTAYGALGLLGAAGLLHLTGLRVGLGVVGAGVLVVIGVLALRSAARLDESAAPSTRITSPGRAYLIGLGATAANPLTIVSWAAVFAAASTARVAQTTMGATLLLAGIGLGSATWFTALSFVVSLVRRVAGHRVYRAIDVISGLGLIGFGIALGWQTLAGS